MAQPYRYMAVREDFSAAKAVRQWLSQGSLAGFVDHCFPDTFGFENEINGFADRSLASESLRNVMRGLFYLGDGIAHSNGEASAESSIAHGCTEQLKTRG
jgi:hypothetical protein